MNEDSNIDKGISVTESQGGCTGNGKNAGNEIPLCIWSIEEGTTVEDVEDDQETGADLNTTEDDTVERPQEGRKSWRIVIAVTLVLACSSLQTLLQLPTLSLLGQDAFFGQMNIVESAFFWQMKTIESTFSGPMTPNESSFVGQTKTNKSTSQVYEPWFVGQTKTNKSTFQAYVPASSTSATDTVVATQTVMFSVFSLVSATLILVIGYRWVTLIGGVLLGVGCLGAAYCNTCSICLVAFLYGALPGMGQAMISVSTTVAILEHFEKRRLIALLIPFLGVSFVAVLVNIYMFILIYAPYISVIAGKIYTWKSSLLLQAGGAGVLIPISLVLKPLKLRKMNDKNSSFLSRVFRIGELKVYRNPIIYTFGLVWFLWKGVDHVILQRCDVKLYEWITETTGSAYYVDYAYTILQSKLSSFRGRWIIPSLPLEKVLAMIFWLVAVIVMGISCCIPWRVTLRSVIILVSIFCVTAGLLNLLASQLHDYIFAIVFYGILGILKGFAAPFFELAIPMLLEEEHVVIGTGFCVMGQGVGEVTMTLAAGEIEKITKTVDGCFYLAGVLFLCGFVFTVGTYRLFQRANRIQPSQPQQNTDQ